MAYMLAWQPLEDKERRIALENNSIRCFDRLADKPVLAFV